MRGKAEMSENRGLIVGITPAYAGKSHIRRLQRVQAGDHPRLCGEKAWLFPVKSKIKGSPPPMRGKVLPTWETSADLRITPAYAGKRRQMCEILDIP